jgi:hypothetical protein
MNKYLQSTLAIATLATFASLGSAQVTLIQENFDSYGISAGNLVDQSGGSGFSGNWAAGNGGNTSYAPTNLTASITGYTNTGLTDSASGAASNNGFNAGGLPTIHSRRAFEKPIIFDTAGQTVWFSALFRTESNAAFNRAFLSLGSNSANMFDQGVAVVGIEDGEFYTTNGDGAATKGGSVAAGTTYLIVGRLTSGGGTSPDTLDVWWNPTDVGSIGDLGAASVSRASLSLDGTFGLNGIQVGQRGTSPTFVDSVRIAFGGSSDENFAYAMTAIPEPSAFAVLASLGALGVVATRRRRTAR